MAVQPSASSELALGGLHSRRAALGRLGGLLLGAAGLSLAAGCPGGSTYARTKAEREALALALAANDVLSFPAGTIRLGQAQEFAFGKHGGFLVHGTDGRWRAFSRRCSHSGCKINYDPGSEEFKCPCHGSRFDKDGQALKGPARKPLTGLRAEEVGGMVSVYLKEPLPAG